MMVEILILILAIPTGILLAWAARDELVAGRKWFRITFIIFILGSLILYIINRYAEAMTLMFVSILSIIAYTKSFSKSWTKRRI
ncbi:hypothetical protein J4461_02100 [Candidatus Pacearchaeota archaeon]|nr:hypothetical protein [Candidatus Pacearchaeota archaeon]